MLILLVCLFGQNKNEKITLKPRFITIRSNIKNYINQLMTTHSKPGAFGAPGVQSSLLVIQSWMRFFYSVELFLQCGSRGVVTLSFMRLQTVDSCRLKISLLMQEWQKRCNCFRSQTCSLCFKKPPSIFNAAVHMWWHETCRLQISSDLESEKKLMLQRN